MSIKNEIINSFDSEKNIRISSYENERKWKDISHSWIYEAFEKQYMYNYSCLGRPIIQFPTDIIAVQEIIWEVKPDLIIETGVAHGGSVINSASVLALLDIADNFGDKMNISCPKRKVIGIDIEIREHNKNEILQHPMYPWIELVEGSSIDPEIIEYITDMAEKYNKILVILDSNHTHEHVISELNAYSPLVSKGSYCIVFDTIIEDLPDTMFPERPWSRGNNSKTAVFDFLENNNNFVIDKSIERKLMITAAPSGFLKRL